LVQADNVIEISNDFLFSKECLMRRNGYSNETEAECSRSSGLMKTLVSLTGGVGIGAGLLYLLDPDKGVKRRQELMEGASGFASSARDYAGGAMGNVGSAVGSALSSAREFAEEKLGSAKDYASHAMGGAGDYANEGLSRAQRYARARRNDARDFIQRQTFGETRAEHRMGVTICAIGSMALGAALMYALDPTMGRGRRRYVREQAGNLASEAGNYARQASEAIRSGIDTAKDKVTGMTSGPQQTPSQASTNM
jgi:hypothetical protein